MRKVKSILTVLVAILALSFASCKKDTKMVPVPPTEDSKNVAPTTMKLKVYFNDSLLTINPSDLTLAVVDAVSGALVDSVTVSGIAFHSATSTFDTYSGAVITLPLNANFHDYKVYLGGRPGNSNLTSYGMPRYIFGYGEFTVTSGHLESNPHPNSPFHELDTALVGTYIVF